MKSIMRDRSQLTLMAPLSLRLLSRLVTVVIDRIPMMTASD